ERDCYAMPNLQPVACGPLRGDERDLPATPSMRGSWAVSYGMPSKAPDTWRADIAWTRAKLAPEKILSVSVVGTVQEGWSIEQLADDYAQCARWALESGADCIETNFSCPNVSTCDGQLYQQPAEAAAVARRVREAIGPVPYIAKIGRIARQPEAERLLDSLEGLVDALAMTNSIASTVVDADGRRMFDGQQRGICGDATRAASIAQTQMLSDLVARRGDSMRMIGDGGFSTAQHVRDYLAAGAESVHIASAAMVDPQVAVKIRRELATASPAAVSVRDDDGRPAGR
ncbi:MAG TPA: hypothetical protein VLT88_15305, partial [Desulfosarcina sp.]|nr:hypothetical protein [Desulfosarcina sp.]